MSAHRWGPVVEIGSTLISRCLNGFCDMDLSISTAGVHKSQHHGALDMIQRMKPQVDEKQPCPYLKPAADEIHTSPKLVLG